jgi:hypothetical protein
VKGSPQPVRITLGRYGEISLADARKAAGAAKAQMRAGVDPRQERERKKREAEEHSFAHVAVVERLRADGLLLDEKGARR